MKGVEEEVVDAVHVVKFQPLHQLFERAAETFAKMSWVCVHKNISHTCHGVKTSLDLSPSSAPLIFLEVDKATRDFSRRSGAQLSYQ